MKDNGFPSVESVALAMLDFLTLTQGMKKRERNEILANFRDVIDNGAKPVTDTANKLEFWRGIGYASTVYMKRMAETLKM